MSVMSDRWIVLQGMNGMIKPFTPSIVRLGDSGKVISYGTGSYGYDVKCGREFKIFTNTGMREGEAVDPLNFKPELLTTFIGDVCIVPPNTTVLTYSEEYIKVPNDVSCLVVGKSTYARCGLHCLTTPLEAGWEGQITLEFANLTKYPIKLYSGQGCAQIVFLQGDRPCLTTYASRHGKYQGQTGITLPRG